MENWTLWSLTGGAFDRVFCLEMIAVGIDSYIISMLRKPQSVKELSVVN